MISMADMRSRGGGGARSNVMFFLERERSRRLLQISPTSMDPRSTRICCMCVWDGRRARAGKAKGKLDETRRTHLKFGEKGERT
jgi:hypothetical protein